MNTKNNVKELSYYGLSLLSYLKESHPQLSIDSDFIKTRADEAAGSYSQAIKDGLSHPEAEELANTTLMRGLLFSPHDTLIDVLWNEFSSFIPQSEAEEYSLRIYPSARSVFDRYTLTDEFADSLGYYMLYTELTGFISEWLEEYEL
jgi:Domain of unknown function (DUF1896).